MAGFLTNSGLQKLLVATPLQPMTVKYMAFDSGQGTPSQNMTALFNEAYRTEIPNPIKDPNDPKNLVFTGFVPTTVGGWTIYGVGLFDSLGILVAYLQLDEPIVKTAPDSALKMSWEQDFILKLANSGETDLIISDSVRFDHEKLTNRNHANAHDIASITGLQGELDTLEVHNNLTGRSADDAHPISSITGLQGALDQKSTDLTNAVNSINTNITDKDSQNVKLTGDQIVNGKKSFNGNISVETIDNGNATITLEDDGAAISAGSGANFTGISIDASSKAINLTGTLFGDGSGLNGATAAKKGAVQLATTAEATTGTDTEKVITPAVLKAFGTGIDAANGWTRLPGGLILQWGEKTETGNPGESSATINFPRAFATACYSFTATRTTASPDGDNSDGGISVYSLSATQAAIHYSTYFGDSSSSLRGFRWIAIGK